MRSTGVKYHFHSNQDVEGLTDDEATRIAGEDADFHRRDLYESIAQGDHPSWTLSIQAMPYEDAKTYRINPFDLTKIWPHSDYPLISRAGQLRAEQRGARHRLTCSSRSSPKVEINTYTQDGPMAYEHRSDDPVYAPNSFGRGYADQVGEVDDSWETDGAMVRQAYTLREDDDDFSHAGTLVREVWDDEIRANFVKTVADEGAPGARPEDAKADAS